MELRYIGIGRAVGIYEAADVSYVSRMLDRDECEGTDANRLRLFKLALCTPLSWGALGEVVREGRHADLVRIIADGPPGPFHILHEHLDTVEDFTRSTDRYKWPRLAHESINARPKRRTKAATAVAANGLPSFGSGALDDAPARFADLFAEHVA